MGSETIFRHIAAIMFGTIVAIFVATLLGLVWPALKWPSFCILLIFWLAISFKLILRQRRNSEVLVEGEREWRKEELPEQFRFVSRDTTVQQLVERIGPYSRVRGDDNLKAFQYDLPSGSAILIFPEWPFGDRSRIRGVQFYPNRDTIRLFP
jgi:hypothetical protein